MKHLNNNTDSIATLKAGMRTVRHHTKGWLKQDLIASGKLVDTKQAIHAKVWVDYNAQLILGVTLVISLTLTLNLLLNLVIYPKISP